MQDHDLKFFGAAVSDGSSTVQRRIHNEPGIDHNPFSDASVLEAIEASDWFTPAFIEEVRQHEPLPKHGLMTGWDDEELIMLLAQFSDIEGDRKFLLSLLGEYISNYLVFPNGNSRSLESIAHELVQNNLLAHGEMSEVLHTNRELAIDADHFLLCIVAPLSLRARVVRIFCNWTDEDVDRRGLIIGYSQIVRLLAQQYIREIGYQQQQSTT